MGDLDLAESDPRPVVIKKPNDSLGAWEESDEILKEVTEPIEGSNFYGSSKPGAALLEQQKRRTNGTDTELTRW